MSLWQHIEQQIERATGKPFHIENNHGVTGGDINVACKVGDGDRRYFIKTNDALHSYMFEAEAAGLREMASSETVRVPEPVCYGEYGNRTCTNSSEYRCCNFNFIRHKQYLQFYKKHSLGCKQRLLTPLNFPFYLDFYLDSIPFGCNKTNFLYTRMSQLVIFSNVYTPIYFKYGLPRCNFNFIQGL